MQNNREVEEDLKNAVRVGGEGGGNQECLMLVVAFGLCAEVSW